MTYVRVIPRDLFNEASLLKCLGQLYLELDRIFTHGATLEGDVYGRFEIEQDDGDGSISVTNVPLWVHGERVRLYRPLNSREPWPLWVAGQGDEDFQVFAPSGGLSNEFRAFITRAQP